ncbi:bestrophin family protein [Lichenibacterium dinghuense]|uniref:bestrophin family protein n=1 Tax=Lichenibacterium dinghuense TaxID=2895977 RepID=UPI001F33466B|nr:bestrophin family ion channel [Lichenibacterium sp. 6Y81]
MIVRDKPSAWQLLFVMRGSIVPTIAPRLAFVTVLSVIVVALQGAGLVHLHDLAALPFSVIGIALSIFAGFRNSACYDRWWEGRKVFGQLLVDVRSLARQQIAYLGAGDAAAARRGAFRAVAMAHLLRDYMRGLRPGADALAALAEGDASAVAAARNPCNMLLALISRDAALAVASGVLTPQALWTVEERVVSLSAVVAAAERINNVPVPYTYSLILHRTAYLFCLLLPFGLAAPAGLWTPLIVLVVSYTFFGLDALGDELERPFSTMQNGLPIDAMARGMEIDVREMLGDPALPEPLRPVDFVLT